MVKKILLIRIFTQHTSAARGTRIKLLRLLYHIVRERKREAHGKASIDLHRESFEIWYLEMIRNNITYLFWDLILKLGC